MDRYINTGAPIRRDGRVVAVRGQEFEPTEKELKQLRHKLRQVDPVVTRRQALRSELGGAEEGDRKAPKLPKVTDLEDVLAGMDDAEAVTLMAAADKRATAAPMYAARLEALRQ